MTSKLFVAGISYATTSAQLEQHFATIGNVVSADVITDRNTGQSKGFGFVEMQTVEEAKKAIAELNNTTLDGRTLIVKEAVPKTENKSNNSFRSNRY